jgi:hypothetical protein
VITTAAATVSILLGLVFVSYGTLTALEMVRNHRTMGISLFGLAWIAMCFTCGPHHFVHGVHLAFEGRSAGFIDLLVLLVGVPAGLIWFWLRLEAFFGKRGDRFIEGTPLWVSALPVLAGAYVTAVGAALLADAGGGLTMTVDVWANVVLVAAYALVGFYLARTQIQNRNPLGGWSASGLAMTVAFSTCAAMHAVYGFSMASAAYGMDPHNRVIDLMAVPAAIFFVWVVRALSRGTFLDWNGAPGRRTPSRVAAAPANAG